MRLFSEWVTWRENTQAILDLLHGANEAHHHYETTALGGKRDEQWADWYADWMTNHGLAEVLPGVDPKAVAELMRKSAPPAGADWYEFTADFIGKSLANAQGGI